jgi:Uma2 family endonuclease
MIVYLGTEFDGSTDSYGKQFRDTNSQRVISADRRSLQADPARSSQESLSKAGLPTMYDLPSEDPEEPGLPDEFHDLQPQLLSRTLRLKHYNQENCFTSSGLNVYYDSNHQGWYKRPDWFLVTGVPRLYNQVDLRRSYVVWQEGKVPNVAIEFLSPGTEAGDLGRFYDEGEEETVESSVVPQAQTEKGKPPDKFEVYESYLKVPHYLVYERNTHNLRYFQWSEAGYQERSLNAEIPQVWLADLEIGLGIWQGEFEGAEAYWLRWCTRDGNWLLTDTELAEQRFEQAEAKLLQAARNLLRTGMEAEQVAEALGLPDAQVAEMMREQS